MKVAGCRTAVYLYVRRPIGLQSR